MIVLGVRKDAVLALLGEPDERLFRTYEEIGSCDETWEYEALGLELTFSSADYWVLGSVTTSSAEAELRGVRPVGLTEGEFLQRAKDAGIALKMEDDFTELGSRDYVCDALGLMFWVEDGAVECVTVFPRYDESGNVPLWPCF